MCPSRNWVGSAVYKSPVCGPDRPRKHNHRGRPWVFHKFASYIHMQMHIYVKLWCVHETNLCNMWIRHRHTYIGIICGGGYYWVCPGIQVFSTWTRLVFWVGLFSGVGHPGPCRVLVSTHQMPEAPPPIVTIKNVPRHQQVSPRE